MVSFQTRSRPRPTPDAVVAGLQRHIADTEPTWLLVDYVDTLVTRRISRRQVKPAVARRLRSLLEDGPDAECLLDLRLSAEQSVRTAAEEAGDDAEHSITDVASAMWRAEPRLQQIMPEPAFISLAAEVEVAVELAVQQPNHELVTELRAQARQRRLVIVSDFHLGEPAFRSMLEHHGINDLFDHVFVSCDHGRNKASGRLYDVVVEQLDLRPEQATMIGDHPRSDIANGRAAGFATYQIPRQHPPRRRALPGRSARPGSAIDQAIASHGPFGELALTLWLFTDRLWDDARHDGVSRLAFLAREGKFLQRAFQTYQQRMGIPEAARIDSGYLLVSRRSTLMGSLEPLEAETFERILKPFPDLTTADLATNLGLDRGIVPVEMADEPADPDELAAIDGFAAAYEHRRIEQRRLVQALVEPHLDGERRLRVVDVGWKGTIQNNLQLSCPDIVVDGRYLGLLTGRSRVAGERQKGLLFDTRTAWTARNQVFRHFKAMYEILFQADHGSVSGYVAADDGTPTAILDDQGLEHEMFVSIIGPLQDRLMAAFTDVSSALLAEPLGDDLERFVTERHSRLMFCPTRAEVELMTRLEHYENFGPLSFVRLGVAPDDAPKPSLRALFDPRSVLGQGWPPMALFRRRLSTLVMPIGLFRIAQRLGPAAAWRQARSRRNGG